MKVVRQIPSIGPIHAALLVALLQTPHRFRTKRQLWAYSGFGVETHDSGEYRSVRGKLQRNRERITVRGLNDNHYKDLKNLFKGATISGSTRRGPLHDFYAARITKGMRPTMARKSRFARSILICTNRADCRHGAVDVRTIRLRVRQVRVVERPDAKSSGLQSSVPLRAQTLRPARNVARAPIPSNDGLIRSVGRVVLLKLCRGIQFRIDPVGKFELCHDVVLQLLYFRRP